VGYLIGVRLLAITLTAPGVVGLIVAPWMQSYYIKK